jgi:hypothetical protein
LIAHRLAPRFGRLAPAAERRTHLRGLEQAARELPSAAVASWSTESAAEARLLKIRMRA